MNSIPISTDIAVVAAQAADKPLVRTRSDHSTCCSEEERVGKAEVAKAKVMPDLFADPTRRTSPEFKQLLSDASVVSRQHFHEDALESCSRKKGYRFLLICAEDMQELYGFAVYKVRPHIGTVAIQKLAVPGHLRNLGFGRTLVKEVIAAGKALGLESICLSSLPAAVPFYRRLGFKEMLDLPATMPDTEDDVCAYVEGQIYMEFRLRRARGKVGKGKRKR